MNDMQDKDSEIDHRSWRDERQANGWRFSSPWASTPWTAFDVLSISFASPGIAKDWGLDKATLGWVLSMELVGMGLGSVLLGGVADKIGRRPTILGCLIAMAVGMFGASRAGGVPTLLVWRLLTGLGIGGMLASINAAAAELSSQRWRSLAVSLMVIGYPVGGVFGGMIVQRLLAGGTWHDVFIFGGWVTAAFIPIVWFLLPESVAFLDRRRKPGALDAINRILTRFGHESMPRLTADTVESAQRSVMDIFKPGLIVYDGAHHSGLFRACHELLLHHQVGAEIGRRHGLCAARPRPAC